MHVKLFTTRLADVAFLVACVGQDRRKGRITFSETKREPEDPPLLTDIRLLILRNAVNTRIICALVLITSPTERSRERLFKLEATNRSAYSLLENYFRSLFYHERRLGSDIIATRNNIIDDIRTC